MELEAIIVFVREQQLFFIIISLCELWKHDEENYDTKDNDMSLKKN
jgi:hypothetical protein